MHIANGPDYENRLQELQRRVETQSLQSGEGGEEMQEEVEIQWSERDYMLARMVWTKWSNHHFTSLRDDLWGNAIFLKEANAISVELKKQVMFQFVLLTDTLLSPLSAELRPLDFYGDGKLRNPTIVAVKVSDLKNGATHYWSLGKLRKRLDLMRKMYDQASVVLSENLTKSLRDPVVEKIPWLNLVNRPRLHLSCIHHNPGDLTPPCYSSTPVNSLSPSVSILSLPSSAIDKVSPNELSKPTAFIKSSSMSDLEYESAIYNLLSHQDPFYDRTPWFSVVGRGFIYLTNLLVPMPLVHKMAIISEEGNVEGYLRVAIQPITGSSQNQNDDINDSKMKYNSRRRSATAKLLFCGETCMPDEDADDFDNLGDDAELTIPVYGSDIYMTSNIVPTESKEKNKFQLLYMNTPLKHSLENLSQHAHAESGMCMTESPKIGNVFEFRVTILDAIDISTEYADIFCQFNFINRKDESFSTEPINNTGKGAPLAFYHVQNFSVEVTQQFLDYVSTQPIIFEVYGHFTQHPLHNESRNLESLLKRTMPPSLTLSPLSKPVPATRLNHPSIPGEVNEGQDCNCNLLVWFEIREMQHCGEYTSVTVEHSNQVTGNSTFLLHQGIQRRIAVTITHESVPEVSWGDVQEVVIGRIRYSQHASDNLFVDEETLSLSLLPTQYIKSTINDRTLYRFEAAWDSSLHNSALLNRVTPCNEKIYVTLTAYIGVENCSQPIIISKDLCIRICHRDAKKSPRALRNLFGGSSLPFDSNCISGVYQLMLKLYSNGSESPGMRRRQRRVVDTSATYVRGEENLSGWRPRGDSLIIDHQAQLEKFSKVLQVEKSRHVMLLQEILSYVKGTTENMSCLADHSLGVTDGVPDGEIESESERIQELENGKTDDEKSERKREKELATKCVKLMQYRIPSIFDFQDLDASFHDSGLPEDSDMTRSTSHPSTMHNTNSSFEICSFSSAGSSPGTHESSWSLMRYVATVTEIRLSPVVSRQGYLSMLDSDSASWVKWWVVVRRPYVFFHNSHRDPVIRALLNLGTTTVEYSIQQDIMLKVQHTFAVCTKNRGFLLQAATECDLHNWLYAFNPLMAGSMRSKLARRNNSINA